MQTEYSPRRSRRKERRRYSGAPGRAKSGEARPAKKKSLIQKILGVFGLGKKKSPPKKKPETRAKKSAVAASSRPPRASSKPEIIEVTTCRVYVGNLPYETTESDLLELFSGAGLVQNTEVITNKHTQRSKGFGFVQFQTIDEAKRAVEELHDKDYMGRKLVVSGAKADDRRGE